MNSLLLDEIKQKMSGSLRGGFGLGLLGLSFVFVVREGLETVLFLTPYSIKEPGPTMAGATLGILASLVFAYVMFRFNKRIDLKRFFYLSSILLIFLAAGLVGSGMHELFENREAAGAGSGWAGSTAFDLGIPEGSVWHEDGIAGSVFAVMFGYATKMEWGRIIAHLVYLVVFLPVTVLAYRSPKRLSEAWARLRASVSLIRTAPPG